MRKIIKGDEPASLSRWKRANPTKRYRDLAGDIRQDIRAKALLEQYYLCAYCCQPITTDNSVNEHVEPQHHAPDKTVDFTNIVASCKTRYRCDDAHGSSLLPLTPLMDECESELKFRASGRVEGLTPRAREMIEVLKLGHNLENNRGLIQQRKNAIEALRYQHGDDFKEEDSLELILDDLEKPDSDNKLLPFAPVLLNYLRTRS